MAGDRRRSKEHDQGTRASSASTRPAGISNRPLTEERESQGRTGATRPGRPDEEGQTASTVRDVMTERPASVSSSDRIAEAARAMRDGDIGDVLVVDDGQVIGIVTDRDIVVRVLAQDRDPSRTTVGEICSRDILTLAPDDAVETAIATMREHAVRRLPVVEDGQPVGIVSLGDLALERDPRSVLGEISGARANR
jgi:CBS domain-containing protein